MACNNCKYNGSEEHHPTWESVDWETINNGIYNVPYYFLSGLGETVERKGKCRICGKVIREVYLFYCYLDDKTDKFTDLI